MAKAKKKPQTNQIQKLKKQISELESNISKKLEELKEVRDGCLCYPFLGIDINGPVVDDIFEGLQLKKEECDGRIDVIVDSSGGDIDAAYNLSMLFRKYGDKELNFIIPRWAKSAATLLVCSGDKILMSPVAELGPVDPQITQINPLEKRLEQFSPLHVESTLDMIRQEFNKGNEKLARELVKRLQFPLTLGSIIKTIEISEQYLIKLLGTRMFSKNKKDKKIKEIARRLTKGYANHGFCINVGEAKNIGLNTIEITGKELDIVWEIHKLNKKKKELQKKIRSKEVMNVIKELPQELLEKLPKNLQKSLELEKSKNGQGEN